ncbi:flagellar motor protein MotB [Paenibacillus mucilaginosus]|uniref:Flagellar motor protein MotB n=3 Tax=Paenibacillus mucilaginosus TaxID=61624 RepID=H6NTG9_9BACL|nr:flagellar motor protein MotB [Paenibacillus mucilaginosus]AEI38789.1 flagellar motor protein MotB [Paenibacillus mucilaginosus KNP414]AFC27116.1 flagellar motor protein MotB [Paenibacillus mucilaginosus 3016]AFH59254.1 flagellar motor protein [Paenibacillus mucilaginosus K02]MCG7215923.1 OmpA family protein [Paenibacillus mucilaginosus]WDM27869.1 OmpA family protein [Paenibacillus mucilaginosus]
MARRRKRENAPGGGHDRWLITYADLITLLLIFFVVMYSMSKVDLDKYDEISDALRSEFNRSHSVLDGGDGITGGVNPPLGADDARLQLEREKRLYRERQFQQMVGQMQAYIEANNLQAQVNAATTTRGVTFTMNDLFLFDLGKAELKPEAKPVLEKLSSLFAEIDATISIEGHTDDLPLATGSIYVDNWGLSGARSLSVLRYFLYDTQLDPQKFVSASYAHTRPVAENTSAENRAKNRRVEIVVLWEEPAS